MESFASLSMNGPLVNGFLFYCCVLILKMMMIAAFIPPARIKHKVFVNEEDYVAFADGRPKKIVQLEAIERLRRNHLNDMENVIPFIFVGFCYCLTSPSYPTALWFFRIFTASRIIHTIAYQGAMQPLRFISWFIGFSLTVVMAIVCIVNFM